MKRIAMGITAFLFLLMPSGRGLADCQFCNTKEDPHVCETTTKSTMGCKYLAGDCKTANEECKGTGGSENGGGDTPEFQFVSGFQPDPWNFWA